MNQLTKKQILQVSGGVAECDNGCYEQFNSEGDLRCANVPAADVSSCREVVCGFGAYGWYYNSAGLSHLTPEGTFEKELPHGVRGICSPIDLRVNL